MDKTQAASFNKWIGVLQGIVFAFMGWFLLTQPVATLVSLIVFLGLYWLIGGIFSIINAIFGKDETSRGLELVGGVIGIIAGLIVLNNAVLSTVFTSALLVYVIAFAFLVNAVIKIFLGSKGQTGKYKWSFGSMLVGILYGILGLLVLGTPKLVTLDLLVTLSGYAALIGGILLVIVSFMYKES